MEIRKNAPVNQPWFDEHLFRGTFVLMAFLAMSATVRSTIGLMRRLLRRTGFAGEHLL